MNSSGDYPLSLNPAYHPVVKRELETEEFTAKLVDDDEQIYTVMIKDSGWDEVPGARVAEDDYFTFSKINMKPEDLDYYVREGIREHFGEKISFEGAINETLTSKLK